MSKVHFDKISAQEISSHWEPNVERPYVEPFRIIHQDEKIRFLGADFGFFKVKSIDELTVSVSFSDKDGFAHISNKKIFIKDYDSSSTPRTYAERSFEKIEGQLSKIGKGLEDLVQISRKFGETVVHSSGLNLSNTSLSALSQKTSWKWNGKNLSAQGLAEVLEVDMQTAMKIWAELYGETHFMHGQSVNLEQLDVAKEVKEKIRERLVMNSDSFGV